MKERFSPGVIAGLAAIGIFVVMAALFGFTVVSQEEEAGLTVEFDPAAYVEDNWDAVQTAIRDNAVPLADVLNAIQPGPDGTIATEELKPVAEEMGLVTTGDALVFRVNGTATVSDVDMETSKGSIGLDVEGYDGPIKVRAWVGSRIPSDESSIRDASGFIEFGDFREQTEFGKVAKELNSKVVEGLSEMDFESLVGQTVDFTGAFTLRTFNQPTIDVSEITLVPIELNQR
jgi:predicted lipoprotein